MEARQTRLVKGCNNLGFQKKVRLFPFIGNWLKPVAYIWFTKISSYFKTGSWTEQVGTHSSILYKASYYDNFQIYQYRNLALGNKLS